LDFILFYDLIKIVITLQFRSELHHERKDFEIQYQY